jgi:ribose transport system permease protein
VIAPSAPSRARHRFSAPADGWTEAMFVPAAIFVLGLVLALGNSTFLTGGNIINILLQGADLGCLAFGMTFVVLLGELDLSVGAGAALAGVVAAVVMKHSGSIELGVLASLGVGCAVGLVNGLVVVGLRAPSFIVTLGTMIAARGVAVHITNGSVITELPGSVASLADAKFLAIPVLVWITAGALVALVILQRQTSFGFRVLAAGGNRDAARLAGVAVNRLRILCFLISGLTMGLAGFIITVRVQGGDATAATSEELYAVAAIVLGGTSLFGGRGSVMRTFWGVLFIVTLENGLDILGVGDDIKQIVIGAVLVLATSTDFLRNQFGRRRRLSMGMLR